MKVYILTEANSRIGFGHVTRCIALCHAFKEYNILPRLLVSGGDVIRDILRAENYRAFNWLKEQRNALNLFYREDIVIIDSYLANPEFYAKASKKVNLAVYMDDFKRLDYPMGIVVNSSVCAGDLSYPLRKGLTYLLGSKYAPLRKEFWSISKKKINCELSAIMIAFGGCDVKNATIKVLRLLIKKYPSLSKNVVIGSAFQHEKEILKIKDNKTNFIISPDAKAMKKTMLDSDIAVSASGQTLYELARTGTPTVAVAVAENQLNNIKGFEAAGFLKYAGWWKSEKLPERIVECIEELKVKEERSRMSSAGEKNVDGQGAKRIVQKILK